MCASIASSTCLSWKECIMAMGYGWYPSEHQNATGQTPDNSLCLLFWPPATSFWRPSSNPPLPPRHSAFFTWSTSKYTRLACLVSLQETFNLMAFWKSSSCFFSCSCAGSGALDQVCWPFWWMLKGPAKGPYQATWTKTHCLGGWGSPFLKKFCSGGRSYLSNSTQTASRLASSVSRASFCRISLILSFQVLGLKQSCWLSTCGPLDWHLRTFCGCIQ